MRNIRPGFQRLSETIAKQPVGGGGLSATNVSLRWLIEEHPVDYGALWMSGAVNSCHSTESSLKKCEGFGSKTKTNFLYLRRDGILLLIPDNPRAPQRLS
jgi:hypothetical protein